MPKVVVYVRADDARVIEATEGREIQQWVRTIVREEIERWHEGRASALGKQRMPAQWLRPTPPGQEGA